jgi:hypothetical protein
MKLFRNTGLLLVALALCLLLRGADAQQPGIPAAAVGYCQIPAASTTSAVGFSACVAASFTGTCSGSTITASAVTGDIGVGWPLSGTGITAGTYVLALGTSTGGAGTLVASQSCTSSGASLTTIGPPNGANMVYLQAEAQNARWRDDGASPTTTVGMLLLTTQNPTVYNGPIQFWKVINATAGTIIDAAFYHSP